MQPADDELVKACLAGDHMAWETIVHRHHQRIYNLAYRFTGRFDEAEDLTQEVFLKVHRMLLSYRPEAGLLGSWIIQVGRNRIIDHYRQTKTERAQTDYLETRAEESCRQPSRYGDPEEAFERQELSNRLHRLLLQLPADLREAVILRDIEEFSYEEIARMLNAPLGTVKSRINRGRVELARLLKGQT